MTFIGYSVENWRFAYCLWLAEHREPPKSLWELKEYWETVRPLTPNETLKIGMMLLEAMNKYYKDSSVVIDMIRRLNEYKAKDDDA